MKKLTGKKYWQRTRDNFSVYKVESLPLEKYFKNFLPFNPNYKCLEVGSSPGTNLVYFNKQHGYFPVALDYVDTDKIKEMFEFNEVDNYEIINIDFFSFMHAEQYDVVTSFGFIEHFDDYEMLIKKHFELLKNNGYMIITIPVLTGL